MLNAQTAALNEPGTSVEHENTSLQGSPEGNIVVCVRWLRHILTSRCKETPLPGAGL